MCCTKSSSVLNLILLYHVGQHCLVITKREKKIIFFTCTPLHNLSLCSLSPSLFLSLSLSLSLTGEEGVCTQFTSQRERERYWEREGGRERETGREREKERETVACTWFSLSFSLSLWLVTACPINIESLQNRLLKVCYVPATSAGLPRVSFFFSFLFLLLQPLTVLMKQTRRP